MKLYLAGLERFPDFIEDFSPKYVLESFAHLKIKSFEKLISDKKFNHLLIDSGAFTFLADAKKTVDWKLYVKKYAEFINRYEIENFFELDIYKIIGIKETEDLRDELIQLTNRKPIPVWHRFLGPEYLQKLSSDFSYIGFGGFALKNIKADEFKFVPKLLEICRKNNCKVHGLGFTNQEGLKFCKFYSVDSTSWNGGRFGTLYSFQNNRISYVRPPGKRLISATSLKHNFLEWQKFQKYAEVYL